MIKYILIFLIAASSLKAQWLQSTGIPANHLVYSMASCNGKMFAGTGVGILTTGGLSVSTDNGITWTSVDMNWSGQSAVMSLAVKDNYIFAGTYEDDLFISSNAGVNWTHVFLNNSGGVFEIGISGNNVVCYTNGTGPIWASTNMGANWAIINSSAIALVNDFLTHDNTLFAGCSNGLGYSTNNGINWDTAGNHGLPSNPDHTKPISGITYHNGKIFGSCIQKIFYSADNGNNWTQVTAGVPAYSNIYSMISYGGKIFAGLTGTSDATKGVLVSSNEGASWALMNQGFSSVPNIRVLMINSEFMLAGAYTGGVYRIPLSTITDIGNSPEIVKQFSLKQNYPNPFNPETIINFVINKKDFISLKVYDNNGKLVASLVNKVLEAGSYSYNFNAQSLPSGVYLYKLESPGFSDSKKMLLIK
ncbi:MAG: T9SS type A sorting domain-containing protein [Bacteroidetes bacterium]|nr:T9SS type A sorting domain-containing protein [Bacteroidota bacterium]